MSMKLVFNGSNMVYRKVTPAPAKVAAKSESGGKAEVSKQVAPVKRADNISGAGMSIPEVKMPPKETEASKKLSRQKIFADLAKIL